MMIGAIRLFQGIYDCMLSTVGEWVSTQLRERLHLLVMCHWSYCQGCAISGLMLLASRRSKRFYTAV